MWKNTHEPDCPVTAGRASLIEARESMDPDVYRGCVLEWDAGGDEEGEHCTCRRSYLLSNEEARMLSQLAGWALDQAHDARGFGDPTYLYFLDDSLALDSSEEDCLAIEAVIESAMYLLRPTTTSEGENDGR